tara:strand:- start:1275 stop:1388 length:114 start_codon:yes stop_codon:yes gene_type:complete
MGVKEYDVFVIGSGVAGRCIAETCAKKDLETPMAKVY